MISTGGGFGTNFTCFVVKVVLVSSSPPIIFNTSTYRYPRTCIIQTSRQVDAKMGSNSTGTVVLLVLLLSSFSSDVQLIDSLNCEMVALYI